MNPLALPFRPLRCDRGGLTDPSSSFSVKGPVGSVVEKDAMLPMPAACRNILSSVALVSLSVAVIQPAFLATRAPRQNRAGISRRTGGDTRRNSGALTGTVRWAAGAAVAVITGGTPGAASAGGAGFRTPLLSGPRFAPEFAGADRLLTHPPELFAIALPARPQAQAFRRPPPA